MSRNSAGTYSLPSGNPVSPNTLIEAVWANTTLTDLAVAMTDSLSRTAQGGMQAPLRLVDGTAGTPALAFTNETSSGLYRIGSQQLAIAVAGTARLTLTSTGVDVTGNLSATGAFTVTGALTAARFIPSGSAVPVNGLYLPAANTIGWATNTTLRASINSTGNVVVAAPTSGVAISVTGVSGQNVLATTDGTASFAVKLGGVSGVELTTSSNHQMFLSTNNIARVTLAAAGNVTIAAPSSGDTLSLTGIVGQNVIATTDGTSSFAVNLAGASGVVLNTSSNHPMALRTNGLARVTLAAAGNVTIAAPSSGDTISATAISGQRVLATTDGTSSFAIHLSGASGVDLNTSSNHPMALRTNGLARVTIAAAGNVTIAAPSSGQNALSVVGVSGTAPLLVTATASNLASFTISENATRYINVTNSNTSGTIGYEATANGVSARLAAFGSGTTARVGTTTNHQFGIEQNGAARQSFAASGGKSSFTVGVYTVVESLAFSATPTFNADNTNYFELGALTGNVTSMSLVNGSVGQTVTIRVIQDGTGSRTVAVPSGAKVTGAVGATANAASLLTLTWTGSSRWEGSWLNLPA